MYTYYNGFHLVACKAVSFKFGVIDVHNQNLLFGIVCMSLTFIQGHRVQES